MVRKLKKILVIIGNHSSNPSSVSNCTEPLLNRLIQRGFEVDIVTNRRYLKDAKEEISKSLGIYRVDDSRALFLNSLNDLLLIDKGFIKGLTKIFLYAIKLIFRLRTKFSHKDLRYGGWGIKSTSDKCMELLEINEYDGVLSISQPFTSHLIAENIFERINKPMKWFIFQFDPFSFNKELIKNELERKKAYDLEYRIFSKSDVILLTPELRKFYQKSSFSEFRHKMVPISYANLEEISFNRFNTKKLSFQLGKINCFFAGRLYKDIRNPDAVLDVFSKIGGDITLTLMTNFSEKKDIHADNINFLPLQNRDTALKMMLESNILVNIGNSVEMQVPGKLFEYISTGKPIIHFSKMKNDPALIYLNNYPSVFIINEWEDYSDLDIEALKNFCYDNKNKQYSFQEVSNAMHEYVGEKVSDDFVDTILGYLVEDTT